VFTREGAMGFQAQIDTIFKAKGCAFWVHVVTRDIKTQKVTRIPVGEPEHDPKPKNKNPWKHPDQLFFAQSAVTTVATKVMKGVTDKVLEIVRIEVDDSIFLCDKEGTKSCLTVVPAKIKSLFGSAPAVLFIHANDHDVDKGATAKMAYDLHALDRGESWEWGEVNSERVRDGFAPQGIPVAVYECSNPDCTKPLDIRRTYVELPSASWPRHDKLFKASPEIGKHRYTVCECRSYKTFTTFMSVPLDFAHVNFRTLLGKDDIG
jgi:hypothetical protein